MREHQGASKEVLIRGDVPGMLSEKVTTELSL